ncbi:MAG: type I glyceraldehyde-3-phosphate dehydrogenase [Anaerolineae bacterium]|jgi:glyceraldehyde 3-phosphate dehydrogenase
MAKVALNGFGRIGRAAFKIILDTPELELVAINDLAPTDNLAYLLKYDTVYGRYGKSVEVEDGHLVIDGEAYPLLHEKDPAQLPWGELGVDIALECTGVFRTQEDLQKHIEAGAKFAILSAPAKSEMATVVHGVNVPGEESQRVISCASCTTNCITPVVEVMGRRIGVEKAIMTTIHAYTSSQAIVDAPSSKIRRGRAGAANFVPTSTGAAIATTKVLPQYEGKFDGVAVRGPVPSGSIADIVFVTSRDTSVEEVNNIFREEAASEKYLGILGVTEDPIVSSDIIKDPRASVVDLGMTQVVDGNLVKVMSWYDNEWGYTSQMIREALRIVESMA